MKDFKEWLSDYLRYFLLGFAILAVIAIAVFGITIYKKLADPVPQTKQPAQTDTVLVETEPQSDTEEPSETVAQTSEKNTESGKESESEETDTDPGTDNDSTDSQSETQSEKETSTQEETEPSTSGGTEKDPEYVRLNNNVNLRSGPSTDDSVITSYETGRIAKFLGREGDWYKVRIGGREGYMSSLYLDEVAYEQGMENEVETEPETEPPTEPAPIYKTLKGSCYLRADTSKESTILGTYPVGSTVQFLEDVGGWYRVQVDGMTGYMGAQFF